MIIIMFMNGSMENGVWWEKKKKEAKEWWILWLVHNWLIVGAHTPLALWAERLWIGSWALFTTSLALLQANSFDIRTCTGRLVHDVQMINTIIQWLYHLLLICCKNILLLVIKLHHLIKISMKYFLRYNQGKI